MNMDTDKADIEITIGICGHRWVRESQGLLKAIDKAIEKIAHAFSNQELMVLSPLAEGADRIVAKRILSLLNSQLVALLPFPMEEYLKDFSTPESVREFHDLHDRADQVIELPGSNIREEAYVALAEVLIEQSDILIAIWDGQPANGRGGTAEIVLDARERGVPLVWILHEQSGPAEGDVILSEEAQKSVVFERFPPQKPKSEP